jgi:hypothetical protein
MSESGWITIATIVISSVTTLGAAHWQVRTMRATANPRKKVPKPKRNVVGRITYFIKKYILDVVMVAGPSISLFIYLELLPFGPASLAGIVLDSVLLTFSLTMVFVFNYFDNLFSFRTKELHDLIRQVNDTHQTILNTVKVANATAQLNNTLHNSQKAQLKRFNKSVEQLKKLSDERNL